MTGTSKAILSMCVLLLAALVVYYGMAPQESVMGRQADLPTERQSKLGNNPGEEYIKKLGAPPIAADIKDEPISEASSVVEIEDVPETVLIDKPIVEKILEKPAQQPVEDPTFVIYQVKEGETLGEIASEQLGSFKMWREIARVNNITEPNRIMPGRTLKLPTLKKEEPKNLIAPVVTDGQMLHRVQDGETLSSIAGDYYGDVNKYAIISKANPSIDPDRLAIGSVLIIPKR